MTDKRIELAKTLIEMTASGAVEWELLSGDSTVVANLGSGRVVVSREPSNNSIDVVIRIYNSAGNVAEEFSDVTLTEVSEPGNNWLTQLNEMLTSARRKALGSDELLDDIIRDLKGSMPF